MRSILKTIILVLVMTLSVPVSVWSDTIPQSDQEVTETATTASDSLDDGQLEELVNDTSLIAATPTEAHGFHKSLKTKFIFWRIHRLKKDISIFIETYLMKTINNYIQYLLKK